LSLAFFAFESSQKDNKNLIHQIKNTITHIITANFNINLLVFTTRELSPWVKYKSTPVLII